MYSCSWNTTNGREIKENRIIYGSLYPSWQNKTPLSGESEVLQCLFYTRFDAEFLKSNRDKLFDGILLTAMGRDYLTRSHRASGNL